MLSQRATFRTASYSEQCTITHNKYQRVTGLRADPQWTVKHTWNLLHSFNRRRHAQAHAQSAVSSAGNVVMNVHNSPLHHSHLPIADSGASDTFVRAADQRHLKDVTFDPLAAKMAVGLPNGAIIHPMGTGWLPVHPSVAPIKAHIFGDKELDRSLISLSDYTNRDCKVELTKTAIEILSPDGVVVLRGAKTPTDKLWTIDFADLLPAAPSAACAISESHEVPESVALLLFAEPLTGRAYNVVSHQYNADFVAYWHACMGSPPIKSFLQAVSRGYINIARLTTAMIRANLPHSIATAKGHLNLHKQGYRSTHPVAQPPRTVLTPPGLLQSDEALLADPDVTIDVPRDDGNELFVRLLDLSGRYTSDTTGRMMVPSIHGSNYILVATFNNYVHLIAMPSRTAGAMLNARRKPPALLALQELQPDRAPAGQ